MTAAEQIRQEERDRQELRIQKLLAKQGQRTRDNLHAILADRGLPVPDVVRARIDRCDDIDQLMTWLRRAATAESAAAILEGD